MKQGSQGLPGGSGQLEGTSPSFDLSRAELGSEGPILVPWLGDTLGGALLPGNTPNVGRRAPSACFCAEVPALPRRFRRAAGLLESHMMSQTMTQAGCLNPTQRRSCTMSHSACCIRGTNTWPHAPGPFTSSIWGGGGSRWGAGPAPLGRGPAG